MNGKQLTIEDVIKQLNGIINNVDGDPATTKPTKMYVNAAQMAVVRQMMDAGALSNRPPSGLRPAGKEIYEKEEPDEVPQVQRNDNSK